MGFITENLGTILVSGGLIIIVALAIRSIRNARKRGGCVGCPGNCGGGGISCSCDGKKEK